MLIGSLTVGIAVHFAVSQGNVQPSALIPRQPQNHPLATAVTFASATPEDQGNRAVGDVVRRTVMVQNGWTGPLRLSIASKSCGCVDALLSKQRLDPGEVAELTLVVTVVEAEGRQRHGARIEVSALEENEPATFSGWVWASWVPDTDVIAFPAALVVQGVAGGRCSGELVLRRTNRRVLDLVAVEASGWPQLTFKVVESAQGYLRVRFDLNVSAATHQTVSMNVRLGGAAERTIRMPMTVIAKWPVVTEPPGFVLCPGEAAARRQAVVLARSGLLPDHITLHPAPEVMWVKPSVVERTLVGGRLVIQLDSSEMPAGARGGSIWIKDGQGRVIGEVPVAIMATRN